MGKRWIFKDTNPAICVCLYRRVECKLILGKRCPVAEVVSKATDFREVKKLAAAADRCKKRGRDLTKAQYNRRKFWVLV